VSERANLRRTRRSPERAQKDPDLGELPARLAQQAEAIDELRREVTWLTEEFAAQEAEIAEGSPTDLSGEDEAWTASRRLSRELRRLVHRHLPQRNRLVVASGGDEAFLNYPGCTAEHLSRDRSGAYAGAPPSCGRAAVVQLEAARWRGADVLVIPKPELWWLRNYPLLVERLETRYALVRHDDEVGAIWDIRGAGSSGAHDRLAELCVELGHQPAILDWGTGQELAAAFAAYQVFSPVADGPRLPYLDGTVDVVAVGDSSADTVAEARRVARALVVRVVAGAPATIEVVWRCELGRDRSAGVSIAVVARDGRPSAPGYVSRLLDTLPPSFAGEVVIDRWCNASAPTQLRPESPRLKRVKLVDCSEGDDFHARVRRCAEAASGEMLVVLDGATWPVASWLPQLVNLLGNAEDAGVVTGMIVEPDGRLVVPPPDRTAEGAHGDELEVVRHSYVRALDAAPEALFATWRELLLERGEPLPAFCEHVR
jgi:hypothetical protein